MSVLGWILVISAAAVQVAGALLMRLGVDRAGGFRPAEQGLANSLGGLALQPAFVIGVAFYVLAALVWFVVVSREPLSLAYPVLVGLTFLFVTVGAVVLFHESLTLRGVIGLVVVLAGIILIGKK